MDTTLVSSMEVVTRSRLATVSDKAVLADAASVLGNTQITLVVVCDSAGAMVGVVSKTDVVRQIDRCSESVRTIPVVDLMTRDVWHCRPTDSLRDVLSLMHTCGFVHFPVLDADSKPLGVVNARDALRVLLAQGNDEVSLLRDYIMGTGYR